ncbi:MAG: TPM domain-containing protein [Bacteroidota bacterium]
MGQTAADFFTPRQKEEITKAIRDAEQKTSGEIRVHLENTCQGDVLDRAATIFDKLRMADTDQRNGVLIYLAIKSKKFAILGDSGINARVPEGFWNQTRDVMAKHFRDNEFTEGLVKGIAMAAEQLKKYFPWQKEDTNELPNDISFGKNQP